MNSTVIWIESSSTVVDRDSIYENNVHQIRICSTSEEEHPKDYIATTVPSDTAPQPTASTKSFSRLEVELNYCTWDTVPNPNACMNLVLISRAGTPVVSSHPENPIWEANHFLLFSALSLHTVLVFCLVLCLEGQELTTPTRSRAALARTRGYCGLASQNLKVLIPQAAMEILTLMLQSSPPWHCPKTSLRAP